MRSRLNLHLLPAALILALASTTSGPARASDPIPSWTVELTRPDKPIPGMTLHSLVLPVQLGEKGGSLKPYINVSGSYLRKGATLSSSDLRLAQFAEDSVLPPKEFTFKVFFTAENTTLEFLEESGESKTVEAISMKTVFPRKYQNLRSLADSNWNLFVGAGNTTYQQSDFGSYRSWNVSLMLRYRMRRNQQSWLPQLEATVLTPRFTSNPSEYAPLFGSIHGSFFRRLQKTYSWQYGYIGAGASYYTMISNGSPFGFAHLVAPSLEFVQKFLIPKQDTLELTARVTFLDDQLLRMVLLQQRAYSVGLSYTTEELGPRGAIWALQATDLSYRPDPATKTTFRSLNFSLGFRI